VQVPPLDPARVRALDCRAAPEMIIAELAALCVEDLCEEDLCEEDLCVEDLPLPSHHENTAGVRRIRVPSAVSSPP
jgi:hypothetical protein